MKKSASKYIIFLFFSSLWVQASETNFPSVDELSVVKELPDPFTFFNSDKRISNFEEWERRRSEIKELFQYYEYGQIPPIETNATGEIVSTKELYSGKATLYHAKIKVGPNGVINGNVRWIVPKGDGPFPLIQYTIYNPSIEEMEVVEKVVNRGYIVAEWYLYEYEERKANEVGQVEAAFPDYDTGIVGQWAWAASACFDYFRKLPKVDAEKIIVTGNSKRGKTVLLAAAMDERIPMVVPCCTGIGGSGVFRFNEEKQDFHLGSAMMQNETPRALYSKHLYDFNGKEDHLPIDQHLLGALVAPRPILIICGVKDKYDRNVLVQAGYRGAKPVYEWMGVGQNIGFRCHPGGHGYYDDDWYATLDFAEMVWYGKTPENGTRFDELGFPPKDLYSWTVPGIAD